MSYAIPPNPNHIIRLHLTDKEADMLVRVIRATPTEVFYELMRENLPDPYTIGMQIQVLRNPEFYGLVDPPVYHDWVEVTSHEQAEHERYFICSHCSEFKIEKIAA